MEWNTEPDSDAVVSNPVTKFEIGLARDMQVSFWQEVTYPGAPLEVTGRLKCH